MRVLAGHEIIKLQYSLQSQCEETGALLTYLYPTVRTILYW